MPPLCRSISSVLVVAAGLGALGGCVDTFTSRTPENTPRWTGTSDAGKAVQGCGPVMVDAALLPELTGAQRRIVGQATPMGPRDETMLSRVRERTDDWWVEGFVAGNNVVELELRETSPLLQGMRPYSTFRGQLAGDVITLNESVSPCGRTLQLQKG